MTRKIFYCVALAFVGCLSTIPCGSFHAQTTSATITGFVNDQSKAAIASVKVDAINTDTNIHSATTTNSDGNYTIPNLPPGNYKIEVEKAGFKSIAKPDIVLHLQEVAAFNFVLAVGSISEVVTVQGGGINMNTTDGTVSTVIDQTYVANMPLNGRSFQDLIALTPGALLNYPGPATAVSGPTAQGFSVNGQRIDANYFTVDGVSANTAAAVPLSLLSQTGSQPVGTAIGTTQALVSVDDMQEFRVQTSSYAAQYGRNPGGQIGIQTKSGTNEFHGDAYDYLRNNAAGAANDWFNDYFGLPEQALRQNDFGGAVGGPVRIPGVYNGKDKTFFFVNYEGLRLTQPAAAGVGFVPDLCLRGLAPSTGSTSCTAVGLLPAAASIQTFLRAFPYPNYEAEAPIAGALPFGAGEDLVSPVGQSSINSYSIRFDQVVTQKMTTFFRFSNTGSFHDAVAGGAKSLSPFLTRTYTGGVNYTFSNKWSNEFRWNYTSSTATIQGIPAAYAFTDVASSGTTGVGGTSAPISSFTTALGIPSTWSAQFDPLANGIGLNSNYTYNTETQWNPVDIVSYVVGSHQLKFGVDYRRVSGTDAPANMLSIMLNLAGVETGIYNPPTGPPPPPPALSTRINPTAMSSEYPLYTNFSAFAEDTWKVTHRLTLDYGLRWDVNPAPGVWQGNKPYTIEGTNPSNYQLASPGSPLWQTTWFNMAPRFGAAYLLRTSPGWQTVLRGGGGVFYDTGQQLGSISYQGPGFASAPQAPTFLNGCTFPGFGMTSCPQAVLPSIVYPAVTTPGSLLFGFSPHLQLPYTLQWNVSMEQQLGKSQSLTVSYVGSHGSRLLQDNMYSVPTGVTNPNGSHFVLGQNGLTSDYDALQAQFQHRLTSGLTALVSYTWSHCIDYSSINFEIGYVRGSCDFDIRQTFTGAISYNLPNVRGSGFVKAVLNDWGVDDWFMVRSGYPFVLSGTTVFNSADILEASPVYEVTGQPQLLSGSNCTTLLQNLGEIPASGPGSGGCPGGRAINPCAFASSATGPALNPHCGALTASQIGGLAPRNDLRNPGTVQLNTAIRREFPIYDRLKLQFRAEAFNVFNHPNFGPFTGQVGSPKFGLATAMLATSAAGSGGLASQYQTGGPRNMQFALKLIF